MLPIDIPHIVHIVKIFFIYCDITLHWSKRDVEGESGNVCYSDYKTICIISASRI